MWSIFAFCAAVLTYQFFREKRGIWLAGGMAIGAAFVAGAVSFFAIDFIRYGVLFYRAPWEELDQKEVVPVLAALREVDPDRYTELKRTFHAENGKRPTSDQYIDYMVQQNFILLDEGICRAPDEGSKVHLAALAAFLDRLQQEAPEVCVRCFTASERRKLSPEVKQSSEFQTFFSSQYTLARTGLTARDQPSMCERGEELSDDYFDRFTRAYPKEMDAWSDYLREDRESDPARACDTIILMYRFLAQSKEGLMVARYLLVE